MDRFNLYVPNFLPKAEYFGKGHTACMGCGLALGVRLVYKVIGERIKKGKWEVPWKLGVLGVKTESGEAKGTSLLRIDKGNGGGGKATICFDYEGVNDLGVIKKHIPMLAVAEDFDYVGTASIGYPFDLIDKVKTAMESKGESFLHILCPCPANWGFDADSTVKAGRLAVESNAYPLYEVVKGVYRVTVEIPKPRKIEDYINFQGRFKKAGEEEVKQISQAVAKEFQKIKEKV
jgi:pyruvate/2-oxoacid:ferredoxin oxidoreductase beta subunit